VDPAQLLNDLCVRLGFCLPPDEQHRIIRLPPSTIDAFTDDVITSEGLDPATIRTDLRVEVRAMVARHFEKAERRVAEAEQRLGVRLPERVRALYAASDGRYAEAGQWYVVWPLGRVVEDNQRAWSDGTLPRELVAFGDDGTGNRFCVSPAFMTDEVLRWNSIDLAVEASEGTVAQFVKEWL
jgi:hypothetical protein